MRNSLRRLVIRVAEAVDRNLITVPDVDEHDLAALGVRFSDEKTLPSN